MNEVDFQNGDYGFDEPSFNTYTELGAVTQNDRTYDQLSKTSNVHTTKSKKKSTFTKKVWLTFIGISIVACTLTSVITYIIVDNRKDSFQNSVCDTKNCRTGQCYLNSEGQGICRSSTEQFGDIYDREYFHISTIQTECPSDWFTYDTSCYKGYSDEKTWLLARDFCRSSGANLLSVHSQSESQFLVENFPLNNEKYWMGLADLKKDRNFSWNDGTSLDYTNWNKGEPNNVNDNEHCVHLIPENPGTWNDNNCFMSLKYICKRNTTNQCGRGSWIVYNESCYMFNPPSGANSSVDWNEARTICQDFDADLTSIQSKNEYNVLLSEATKSRSRLLWIGLNDLTKTGGYKWVDGTNPTFLSWNAGQPDRENHHCAGVLSIYGNWDDKNCNDRNGYICEKSLK